MKHDLPAPRTSITHPLQIAEVAPFSITGQIGITFCPGKKDPHALTGGWDRDLTLDLDAIVAWGANTIVTLIEPHEFILLGVPELGTEIKERGMEWLHLPIRDLSVPGASFESDWKRHGSRLNSEIQKGARVLVHCRGGLGRAGLVAARLIIETGHSSEEAIRAVRAVRPGAIETREQEEYLTGLDPILRSTPIKC